MDVIDTTCHIFEYLTIFGVPYPLHSHPLPRLYIARTVLGLCVKDHYSAQCTVHDVVHGARCKVHGARCSAAEEAVLQPKVCGFVISDVYLLVCAIKLLPRAPLYIQWSYRNHCNLTNHVTFLSCTSFRIELRYVSDGMCEQAFACWILFCITRY